ncbi:hypothetical protein [Helicobacter japonicus]|uniref:DUF1104 domain-containing protein n=1 Tax=Helicobacter japonicus TaxID=425400 RepID=A0A4U8TUS4_9HELI|nr:hypothetical protein [Helicobacter japonicus]TLE02808.1 hypothetical protein LS65_002475 [Helicobacter japonicus]
MKKLFIIAMGIIFSASMANAFDFKGETYGNGKNTKEVASAKKKEMKPSTKSELDKKKKEAIKKQMQKQN